MLYMVTSEDGRKGRSFSAELVACIQSDASSNGWVRPNWAVFASSVEAIRPFAYNVRTGREAFRPGENGMLNFPTKDDRFEMQFQQVDGGAMVTIFSQSLYRHDLPARPKLVEFVVLLSQKQVQEFTWPREQVQEHLKRIERRLDDRALDLLPWFAARVDKGSKWPMPRDLRFYAQLMAGLIRNNNVKISETSGAFRAEGLERLGLAPALRVAVSQENLGEICAEQAKIYFKTQKKGAFHHGSP